MYGDGFIIIEFNSGERYIIATKYIDDYPFYVNYLYDKSGRFENWTKEHNKREISATYINPDDDSEQTNIYDHHVRGWINIKKGSGDGNLRVGTRDYKTVVEIFTPEEVKYIAIASDGLDSFYKTITTETSKTNKSIPYIEVIDELIAFKNFNGQFVQRRMNKFLKDCERCKWHNADDISLAVVHMGS
jgi:hypothetical protein